MTKKELIKLIEKIRGYCLLEEEYLCQECSTSKNVLNMIEESNKKETK